VTVLCVYLGIHVNEVRKQKEAVAWVKDQGGWVFYEYDQEWRTGGTGYGWEPEFARELLGDDFFYDVNTVYLYDSEVHDLSPLAFLKNLEFLLVTNTKVTREEIEKLQKALPQCTITNDFGQ